MGGGTYLGQAPPSMLRQALLQDVAHLQAEGLHQVPEAHLGLRKGLGLRVSGIFLQI